MKRNIMMLLLFISILELSARCFQTRAIHRVETSDPVGEAFLTSFVRDDQLFLNIPEDVLDRPMLFIRYGRGSSNPHYLQVTWSLQGDKMLLKVPSIRLATGIVLPFKPDLVLDENILAVFPLEDDLDGGDGYAINITDLVLGQIIEWIPGFSESLVPEITMLLGSKNLNGEVIVKTLRGLVQQGSKIAVPVFFGFAALPKPMKTRRFDYRMGFTSELSIDRKNKTHNVIANINRWRLEKMYRGQAVSVPIKPITLLLSPDIPKLWRSYVKAGIEEWLPAFEAAGFKDAIVVKEVDSISEWEAHSIQNSLVLWGKKKYLRGHENEDFGGTVSKIYDLRTGEILRGDIYLGASVRTLSEEYFIRVAPLDERARQFPFPDELVGALVQSLTAHEAGHVFGLIDGNYGEFGYPFDKMNDSVWLRKMGHTPSVMNYARSNNIPQPEDSISSSLLIQKVGPTDRYSIQWAYTEFSEGMTQEEENGALERMVRWQDSVPWYRFNMSQVEKIGPATMDEVVETDDPVRRTRMALNNLRRTMALLPLANHDQADHSRLDRLYDKTLEHWFDHMAHVVSLIGGYVIHYKSIGQPGSMYTPIQWEMQEEALDFLLINAFEPPDWLVNPGFTAKTQYSTYPDKVLAYQQQLLLEMVSAPRLKRLENLEQRLGQEGVIQKYLAELQAGLFMEVWNGADDVGPGKQEIQMTFIDRMIDILKQERLNFFATTKYHDYTDYSKGLMMSLLIRLKKDLERLVKMDRDAVSPGHWQRGLKKINAFLQ